MKKVRDIIHIYGRQHVSLKCPGSPAHVLKLWTPPTPPPCPHASSTAFRRWDLIDGVKNKELASPQPLTPLPLCFLTTMRYKPLLPHMPPKQFPRAMWPDWETEPRSAFSPFTIGVSGALSCDLRLTQRWGTESALFLQFPSPLCYVYLFTKPATPIRWENVTGKMVVWCHCVG